MEQVISELQWFYDVLKKGSKTAEFYEAQADVVRRALKELEAIKAKAERS